MPGRKSLGAVYARAAGRRVPDLQSLVAYRRLGFAAGRLLHQLYLAADNYGNFFGGAGSVTEYLYPEEAPSFGDVAGWLAEIEAAGLLSFYIVSGRKFLHLSEWCERERGAVIVPLAPHQCGEEEHEPEPQVVDNERVQNARQVGDVSNQKVNDEDVVSGFFCADMAPSWRSDSPSSSPIPPSPPPPTHATRAHTCEGSRFVKVDDGLDGFNAYPAGGCGLPCEKEDVVRVMKGSFWAGKLQEGVVIEAEAEAFLHYYGSGKDRSGRLVHSWKQKAVDWLKNTQLRAAEMAIKESKNGRVNDVVPIKAREL